MGFLKKLFEGEKRAVEHQTLGDAHFASEEEIRGAGLLGDHGIRLGQYYGEKVFALFRKGIAIKDGLHGYREKNIRYRGDAHLLTVAPTRSGKGRDILIPVLLEYEGSCIIIDPKGQLAAVTSAQRERMGQRVLVLNPFDLLPRELGTSARYNPMDLLDPTSRTFGADCTKLAEAIVAPGKDSDSHWTESARELVAGVIGHLAATGSKDEKNLAMARDIIAGPDDVLVAFAKEAVKAGNPFISQKLARFANEKAQNWGELSSILSNARTQTGFIGVETITENLKRSDFRFSDLKEQATTVYLVLPGEYLDTCGKWFRLIVASAVHELWRGTRGAFPVLAILDEFAQVGRLSVIENAMAMAAGYGLQLWPILQDLTQLKKHYGDSWETFLSGAEIQQFFAPRDQTTADYMSKRSGVKTVVTYGESSGTSGSSMGSSGSHSGSSAGQAQQPLLHAHKASGLGPRESIIFGPQNIVIHAFRKPYFHITELEGLACYDPYHNSGKRRRDIRLARQMWPSPPSGQGYEPYNAGEWSIAETPGNPWPVMRHTPTDWAFRIIFNRTKKKRGELDPYLDCTAIDHDDVKAFVARDLKNHATKEAIQDPAWRQRIESMPASGLDGLARTAIVAFCDRLGVPTSWQNLEALKLRKEGGFYLHENLRREPDLAKALGYKRSEWIMFNREPVADFAAMEFRHVPSQWAFITYRSKMYEYFGTTSGVHGHLSEVGKPLDDAAIERLQNAAILACHDYSGTPPNKIPVDYGTVYLAHYAQGIEYVKAFQKRVREGIDHVKKSGRLPREASPPVHHCKYYMGHTPYVAAQWASMQGNIVRHKPTGLEFHIFYENKHDPLTYHASISGPAGLSEDTGYELGHAAITAFLERERVVTPDELWRTVVKKAAQAAAFLDGDSEHQPYVPSEWSFVSAYAWPMLEHGSGYGAFSAMILFNHEKRARKEPLDHSKDYAAVYWSGTKEHALLARTALLAYFEHGNNSPELWPKTD